MSVVPLALTGSAFPVLAVLAAVAALVGVVALWPRFAARGAVAVVSRTGLLLLSNGTVLLVVAVVLNDQFGFFADWTDLAGALGAGAPVTTATGGAPPSVAFGRGPLATGAPARVLPPLPAGQGVGGRVLTYTVTGARSGLTGEVIVDLPPSYRDPRAAGRAYPVLETFAGYPGSTGQWIGNMQLPAALDTASAAGQVGQTLVVSPALEIPPGQDTECVDAPGHALETWVSQDVPAWVQQHFRVLPDRRAWATIGLSAGGWCSAMTTMLHPQRFGAAVVMGGYFHPEFTGRPPFPPGSAQAKRYDLVALARRYPPAVAMWLETSHADRLSYASSTALLRAARAPMSVRSVVLQVTPVTGSPCGGRCCLGRSAGSAAPCPGSPPRHRHRAGTATSTAPGIPPGTPSGTGTV